MGTTGVNISSLLSALGSTSSGIDVQSAVAQAISADSGPLTQMQNQQAVFTSDTSDINMIETDIGTLQTSLSALTDPIGALNAMTTASSDSSMVTATAESGTVAGTHVVAVNNLASTASWYSGSVATSSTALATGSFSLQVGSNAPVQVNIGGAVDTLDQLASSINGLNAGVTASVVNDSSGSRLAIVSNNSGTANNFTISGATGLNFTQAVTGKDASLTVDGIPVDSASNTVTGVITGVTFNLLSAPVGGTANITIAPDATQASSAVSGFVTAYNAVISDVNQEFKLGSNGAEGPLAGDPAVAELQSQLLSVGSYTSGGAGVATLADLGITMNNDGTLTLNTSTLNSAVQNNYSGVQAFFQGAASNGFASGLSTQLATLTDPTDGAFTVDLQSISNENSDLQTQITNFQSYLASQTTLLTNEYDQADIALQQLPIEEQQINAELGNPTTTTGN
jgi:flagellar hook-associated protein 2